VDHGDATRARECDGGAVRGHHHEGEADGGGERRVGLRRCGGCGVDRHHGAAVHLPEPDPGGWIGGTPVELRREQGCEQGAVLRDHPGIVADVVTQVERCVGRGGPAAVAVGEDDPDARCLEFDQRKPA
jgi:hypothetical protein